MALAGEAVLLQCLLPRPLACLDTSGRSCWLAVAVAEVQLAYRVATEADCASAAGERHHDQPVLAPCLSPVAAIADAAEAAVTRAWLLAASARHRGKMACGLKEGAQVLAAGCLAAPTCYHDCHPWL